MYSLYYFKPQEDIKVHALKWLKKTEMVFFIDLRMVSN